MGGTKIRTFLRAATWAKDGDLAIRYPFNERMTLSRGIKRHDCGIRFAPEMPRELWKFLRKRT